MYLRRSQWPRGVRSRSAAARLLRSWVRIPPAPWMFVCCECCVLSGRVLCDEMITRPEESYRLWCVVVCDLETSRMRRPWPALGRSATAPPPQKKYTFSNFSLFLWSKILNRRHSAVVSSSTSSSSQMVLQSKADLSLLKRLLPVSSVVWHLSSF